MDKKIFKKALEEVFRKFGFQYESNAFYHDDGSIITVITLQKSNFSNSFYINFGFLIKEESPDMIYPKEYDSDVFGRFTLELNGECCQSIDLDTVIIDDLLSAVTQFMNINIKPVLEGCLAKYFEINPKAVHTMSLRAKKYFKFNLNSSGNR
ncbi:hypothetical protein J2Z44_004134 [Clostridium punense]|uniref:DUF4304 domain-containing protein n=1 Tax=Clostridium punense TaxID=1054297 RepID=A0ABS4KAH8_9CLOT|nr:MULTISPECIES: DUF4304 domain-containing protein [Clostridium]EQB89003.1 hypothetical protein M918_22275 [Clostridium sp. BL8]MBP2024276.1 hypothetical protein [Clostridium punense]